MTERPILFSAPMVRAILAGTKTQTRRVVKGWPLDWLSPSHGFTPDFVADPENRACPYGQPGDRLWVRETWAPLTTGYAYRADPIWNAPPSGRWHPSIHMPRAASRITLEITGVRVERLQDISEADAKAEGCERLDEDEPGYVHRYEPDWKLCPRCGGTRLYTAFSVRGALPDTDCTDCDTYVKRYRLLWEQINGPDSWNANPWVWVVEFKRVEG